MGMGFLSINLIVAGFFALTVACQSSNEFAGHTGKKAPVQSKVFETPEDVDLERPREMPLPEPLEMPTVNTIEPLEIVEGQEVFDKCDMCLERAQKLAPQANFTASMANTVNMGFYKVEPSRGICDIHFLPTLDTEIADHEGQNSVAADQIILYCPCDCNWAVSSTPKRNPLADIFNQFGQNTGLKPGPNPTGGNGVGW